MAVLRELSTCLPGELLFASYRRAEGAGCPNVSWLQADLLCEADIRKMIDSVTERATRLNIVYCAGALHDCPVPNLKLDDLRKVMAVNFEGAFLVMQAAYRHLAVHSGRAVFVSSVAGTRPRPGQTAYACSKSALDTLAVCAALELGRFGVTCNVVAPGALPEGMLADAEPAFLSAIKRTTPLRQLASSLDVARAISFLLGPGGDRITGQHLTIDGGYIHG